MSAVVLYGWGNVISGMRKIIYDHFNWEFFSFLIVLLGTYIQCGHVWYRNKFSSCQLELLVSCSNDELQTSLKWDGSSHPFAPECSVSHNLRLKHFAHGVLSFSELCSCSFSVAAPWYAGYNLR